MDPYGEDEFYHQEHVYYPKEPCEEEYYPDDEWNGDVPPVSLGAYDPEYLGDEEYYPEDEFDGGDLPGPLDGYKPEYLVDGPSYDGY
jgi:hypothetical protein